MTIMHYERFWWNETRGDRYDDWGYSTFWMERGEDGYASRQMEVYDNGNVLKYDSSHLEDQYGMLSDVKLTADELKESQTEFISAEEFEAAWSGLTALNRTNQGSQKRPFWNITWWFDLCRNSFVGKRRSPRAAGHPPLWWPRRRNKGTNRCLC